MSFVAKPSSRKSRRQKTRRLSNRQSKRAYLFESLEERLNLSLMFLEVEPNQAATPTDFSGGLAAAQPVAHPGSTGIVDSATTTSALDLNPDYYTFNATVAGSVSVAVINRGGDPGGGFDAGRLEVRVFRDTPADQFDTIGLRDNLEIGESYTDAFSATAGEKFFVRVQGEAGDDDSNYELRIWNSEASDSGGGNNNSQGNAAPLGTVDGSTPLGTSGTIIQPDRDFYEFDAAANGRVSVRITLPEGTGYTYGPSGDEPTNLGIRVRNAAGAIIASSNGTAGNVDIASFDATNGATYYAEVYSGSFGQINSYVLDISMVGAPEGRVTGFVFQDDNQNTFRDPTEAELPGYNVSIDIGSDGATTADLVVSTDAQGFYEFTNVPFGTHRVYLSLQPGFHAIYPDNLGYSLVVSPDNLNMDHIDFATVEADFGDAPDAYQTTLASDGPRHTLVGPILGIERDSESDAAAPLDGSGDDDDQTPDDEDGVTFPSQLFVGTTVDIQVSSSAGGGELDFFFDWDQAGGFGNNANEVYSFTLTGGAETISVPIPAGAVVGATYARFRLSTAGGLGPTGSADNGEVEDYAITLIRANFTVAQTGSTTEVSEPNTADSFTVVLDVQPTTNVVINVSSGDTSEGTVSPTTLTFTPANWNITQSVILTAVDDAIIDGDQFYDITLSIDDAASDDNFDAVPDQTVAAVTHDDDAAGFAVTETAGTTEVTEPNSTDTFSVVLNVQPASNVVIDVTSGDIGEGTVSPATLTFTSVNWNVPQVVTLTAVDDGLIDGDQNYDITLSVNVGASDPAFSATPDRIVAAVTHDRPGFVIAGADMDVTEAGTTDSFTVVLNTQPASDVVVDVTSGDISEGTVSPASLTFTNANWNIAQTVTVTGVDDDILDGDIGYDITLSVNDAASNNLFDDAPDQMVAAITRDDDVAGFTIAISGLTTEVTEPSTTDTFTVVLDAEPASNVVINVVSDDTTEGTVAPVALTFTPSNWDTPQTVTLTAADDNIIDGDVNYTITLSIDAGLSDDDFDAVPSQTVDAVTHDDDSPGFTVTLTDGSNEVTEPDSTDTFTVVLNTQPILDVVIDITSSDLSEGTVAPAQLTFTTINWNIPRTVTLTAADDNLLDGDQIYNITVAVNDAASDDDFDSVSDQVFQATTHDNESASFTYTESGGTTIVSESGTTDTFTVVLNAAPSSNVVILVSSGDTGEATVNVASLTFTTGNWSVAQTVIVTGVDDALIDGDQITTITLSVDDALSDDLYDPLPDQTLSVTTTDDDIPLLIVVESGGDTTVSETGTTDTFSVALSVQPSSDVVVIVSSGDTGEATVSPSPLTFTMSNWNTPQTVTVTGVDDFIVDGNQITTVSIAVDDAISDDAYDGLVEMVSVTTTDDDVTGIVVEETNGNTIVSEPNTTDTFTVYLSEPPATDVVIDVTSGDIGEGTVSPASLTFTNGNWNVPQTVTLTAVDDALSDGDQNYDITLSVNDAASDNLYDPVPDKIVAAVTRDDDSPGFQGRKYHDLNGDGDDESGADPGLMGWTIELYRNNGSANFDPGSPFAVPYGTTGEDTLVGTTVTDSAGNYAFSDANVTEALINGQSYVIRELQKQGWQQTAPVAPTYHPVTFSTATLIRDLDFGNSRALCGVQPAATGSPFAVTANNNGILSIQLVGGGTFEVWNATNTSVVSVYAFEQGADRINGNDGDNDDGDAKPHEFYLFTDGKSRESVLEPGVQRADIVATAGANYTIRVTGATAGTVLRHTSAVNVDSARNLIIRGSSCGASIFVRDDPNAVGSATDAKSIFVGSYSGNLADFDQGNNLVNAFQNGVKYNAAIIDATFNAPTIAGIQIYGGNGSNIIRIGREINQDASIDGGTSDDVIRAGGGRATIRGGAGSDFIVGGRENDLLYGGAGNDYIHGRAGGDRIFGNDGNDLLSGGDGDDPLIRGGNGNDRVSGGSGRDRLLGDAGTDTGYVEKNGAATVDILVSNFETQIPVPTAPTGPLLGDVGETDLLTLIDRFWADGNAGDGPDTLDEIIALLLP